MWIRTSLLLIYVCTLSWTAFVYSTAPHRLLHPFLVLQTLKSSTSNEQKLEQIMNWSVFSERSSLVYFVNSHRLQLVQKLIPWFRISRNTKRRTKQNILTISRVNWHNRNSTWNNVFADVNLKFYTLAFLIFRKTDSAWYWIHLTSYFNTIWLYTLQVDIYIPNITTLTYIFKEWIGKLIWKCTGMKYLKDSEKSRSFGSFPYRCLNRFWIISNCSVNSSQILWKFAKRENQRQS